MAMNDLFGSHGIPLEIAVHIFHLAGPAAWTSVRCASKADAEAYSGVGMSLIKRRLSRCRVDSPELLQFAIEHKLRCLHAVRHRIDYPLPRVATLDWLRELHISNDSAGLRPPADILFPPRLVVLELDDLGFQVLPPLPATLERLMWREFGSQNSDPVLRTGPFPESLLLLEVHLQLHDLELPDRLPPSLQHLTLTGCYLGTHGDLPALPSSLLHLSCRGNELGPELPALPAGLTYLNCMANRVKALPDPLPPGLCELICGANSLRSMPPLPVSLKRLDCWNTQMTRLAQLPPNLTYLSCFRNDLRRLPALPRTLQHLNTAQQDYGMEELPALHHTALKTFDCQDNGLTSLPRLPESVRVVKCSGNSFTEEAQAMIRASNAVIHGL